MAAGATDGQTQKGGSGGRDPVHDALDAILLHVDAPLLVQERIPVESGGDDLFLGSIRNQVARQLLDGEPVERQVAISGTGPPSRGTIQI